MKRAFLLLAITGGYCLTFNVSVSHAQFSLGDAASYAVLYEGSGSHNLIINSSPDSDNTNMISVVGNVGLGTLNSGNPTFQFNNPASIAGNINFANTNTGHNYAPSGGVQEPGYTVNYGVNQVNTDLTTLNSLSATLANYTGTSVTISGTTSLNASGGNLVNGVNVYSVNTGGNNWDQGGGTLTINGSSSQYVVLNFNMGNKNIQFDGSVQLTGGITANQVIFNIIGGNTNTLMGGGNYQTAAGKSIQQGTFLDPDGVINVNDVVIEGHLFGGDSSDMQVVSGANVIADVPEPGSAALVGMGLAGLLALGRRRNK